MHVRSCSILVAALGLAACAPSAGADTVPAPQVSAAPDPEGTPIRIGESASGVISESDPVWGGHGHFQLYRFEAREGDALIIDLTSPDFDPYLVVGDRSGGVFNPIMEDDDSGEGLGASVRFVVTHTGTYWVLAQGYSAEATGAFELSVRTAAPPVAAVAVAPGTTVEGRLEQDDAFDFTEERIYDAYTFDAAEGIRYMIRMRSTDFDSYLLLGQGADENFVEITRNDDGGGDLDARIAFVPDHSGVYTIRASAFDGSPAGAYTLDVTEMAAPGPLVVTPLTIGETVGGALDVSDRMASDGSFYDVYSFSGREGQRLTITMRSDDFDSYLQVGEPGGIDDDFWGEYNDDDSGGGLDARVVFVLWRDGEFLVRANSLFPDEIGRYTISLEELPPPGPVSVQPIGIGTSVEGELEPTDAVLEDGSHHDIYTFSGTAGQRIRITLASDDFDAYLAFGPWDGAIDITHSDDDGGGGLDSMLEVTLPATGTYAVQANSLRSAELGAYVLSIVRLP